MVIIKMKNLVKCAVVGDGMVGKTCLIKKFLGEKLPEKYVATIQDDYVGKVSVAGDQYEMLITDTSIQHDYIEESVADYRDSDVFVVCYSVVDRESFESVKSFWTQHIKKETQRPFILVATQVDLRKEKSRHVSESEGIALAKKISADSYIECSATSGNGLNEVFVSSIIAHLRYKKSKLAIIKDFFGR